MRQNNSQRYIYGETMSAEAPRPSPAVYEILSRHLMQDGVDKNESHEALNDIYKALANSEIAADTALDRLEQTGLINREDGLILTVLLTVSRTLGPNLNFLRQAIITGNFSPEEVIAQTAQSGLEKSIIDYLQNIVRKIGAQRI